jgi:Xaa-Pro aminopeptidase
MVETALKAVIGKPGEPPALSMMERDRRWALVRAALSERGLDALIATGTDLLYLSGGVSGEEFGLLPADPNDEFEAIVAWRWLVDVPAEVLIASQEWVKRVRSGRSGIVLADRIAELRLGSGRIGWTGPFTFADLTGIQKKHPALTLIEAADIVANARTIKSEEEVALIDRANHIFDACVRRVAEIARPGMLGREIVQIGLQAMWDAGGDLDSTFLVNFGAAPVQSPVWGDITLNQAVQDGDIATLTAHSRFHHYSGHSDQEIAIGSPKPRHERMFEAVKAVRNAVLQRISASVTMRDLVAQYEAACRDVGYRASPHSQIHQYGINVPEFPGPAFRIPDGDGGRGLGGAGNFTLAPGMIFSISPTLIDGDTGETLLGGNTLVVTGNGYRELGGRAVELLVAG